MHSLRFFVDSDLKLWWCRFSALSLWSNPAESHGKLTRLDRPDTTGKTVLRKPPKHAERERQRDRQRQTEAERQRERERERDRDRERQRQTETETDRDRHTHTETDREKLLCPAAANIMPCSLVSRFMSVSCLLISANPCYSSPAQAVTERVLFRSCACNHSHLILGLCLRRLQMTPCGWQEHYYIQFLT